MLSAILFGLGQGPAQASSRWLSGIREAKESREARKPERIPGHIADLLGSLETEGEATLAGESLVFRNDLAEFYRRRENRPAWIVFGRYALPAAWELLDAVWKSGQEGLQPSEYHAVPLDSLLVPFGRRFGWGHGPAPETAALLDVLLTDAYLKLASHLLVGSVHPLAPNDRWHVAEEKVDLAAYLEKTLSEDGKVEASLKRLVPADNEYGIMKYWLARYRAVAEMGGWPSIPAGKPLVPGARGERVAVLCRRLALAGEMDRNRCGDRYDSALAEGVKRFQGHHGLARSGRVDEATLRELNVPVDRRIKQIRFNLECWRWLPRNLGGTHVRVNIADFTLTAWEDGRPALSMKVVVGRKGDSTPVFSDRILSVSLNPPWHVPESIAEEEILPELRKDPTWLEQRGMELLTSWSRHGEVVQPDTIDWESIEPGKFHFRIRQRPGDGSALGRVKFVLTNPFNIYLHDTPSRSYFSRHRRALSHGCVRLEKPVELAEWLLRPAWTRESLLRKIREDDSAILPLPGDGVPVHILYWTAFADPAGGLHFRQDIYGWDRRMDAEVKGRTAGL